MYILQVYTKKTQSEILCFSSKYSQVFAYTCTIHVHMYMYMYMYVRG